VRNNPINNTDPTGHASRSDTDENGCSGRGPKCIIQMYTYNNGYDSGGMEDSLRGFITNHPEYKVENDPLIYGKGEEFLVRTAQFQVETEKMPSFDEQLQDELEEPQYESLLANQYTPVFFGGISVLATDIQYLALAAERPGLFGASYLVGRAAGIVSLVSTGYQYKHNLYGTTKRDAEIAAATTLVGAVPKPDMSVMTHVGFMYTFLRTLGAIPSP